MRTHTAEMHGYSHEPVSPFFSAVRDFCRRAARSKNIVIGASIVLFLTVVAVFAPWIAPHDPATQYDDGFENGLPIPPFRNPKFILGTDNLGRDVLSRLVYGTRISLIVGVGSMLLATAVGVVLGLISGYFGGKVDMLIMRLTDIIMAFPDFLLTVATVGSLKPGLGSLFFSIAIVRWASIARMARSQTLLLKELEYVDAARAIGVSNGAIIRRHSFPNSLAPIIVSLTMGIAGAILTESSLSFLGLGIQPPTPSWGMMVNTARGYMFLRPSLVFIPSAAIALAVLGFSLLGDGLRDVLDPRMRGTM